LPPEYTIYRHQPPEAAAHSAPLADSPHSCGSRLPTIPTENAAARTRSCFCHPGQQPHRGRTLATAGRTRRLPVGLL